MELSSNIKRLPRLIRLATMTAVLACSFMVSCANQDRVEDDGSQTQSVAENQPPAEGQAPADPSGLGELPPDPSGGTTPPPSADVPVPSETPVAGNDLPPVPPPAEGQTQVAGNDAPPPEGSSTPGTEVAPPPADLPPPVDTGAVAKSDLKPTPRSGGYGRVPKIPASAIRRGKALLNRFYFVRKGDTPKSMAQLIYGDASRKKDLQRWNKGPMAPGRLVFYNSPQQRDDQQMRSFYQERNITPEEYQVKKGDWLSRVASKLLGSSASWKEIAVVNGIEKPVALEPGQKLAVYPRNFGGAAPVSSDAQNQPGASKKSQREARNNVPPRPTPPPPVAPPPPVDVPVSPPIAQEPPPNPAEAMPNSPPSNMDPVPADPFKRKKAKASAGLDIAKLIEQNLFFIVIGAGISVLILALIAVSKRRKSRTETADFNEEGFASPRSKRR